MTEQLPSLPLEPQGGIFETIKRSDSKGYFWNGRDLAKALEYTDYRNFGEAVKKAKQSCFNSGQAVEDHFGEYNELVDIGRGAKRAVKRARLSRSKSNDSFELAAR